MILSEGTEDIDIAIVTETETEVIAGAIDEGIRVAVEVQTMVDDIAPTGIETERHYDSHEDTRTMIITSILLLSFRYSICIISSCFSF